MSMHIECFFEQITSTFSYIVLDTQSKRCVLIDSVMDFDHKSGRTDSSSADLIINRVETLGATVEWILETHVHADHLSAAPHLHKVLGGKIGIGKEVSTVQNFFGKLFSAGDDFARDGSQFDHLFGDGERFEVGALNIRVMHTPGHTPACLTYVIESGGETAAFVGDTLFMPDYGTARCDFPGGDARTLYHSIHKVLSLPSQTKLYMCHDYPPAGRRAQYVTTVAEELEHNIHVGGGVTEEAFVAMRESRDAQLEMPVLILPSVQVNMRAGALPTAEENGISYLKIPVNAI